MLPIFPFIFSFYFSAPAARQRLLKKKKMSMKIINIRALVTISVLSVNI